MKQVTTLFFLFLTCSLLFISCQKSAIEPQQPTSFFSKPGNREAVTKAIKDYFTQNNSAARLSSNGAEFVFPFFTSESQGVGKFDFTNFTLEMASFSAVLGENDFYRRNPDGTLSVHVNSNAALAEYFADLFDPGALYLYGNRGHMSVNYTGEVVEFFPGFYFIDTQNSGRGYSFHGNGRVGANGAGPWRFLTAISVTTPAGQAQSSFSLR